jgi:hypothetical protein
VPVDSVEFEFNGLSNAAAMLRDMILGDNAGCSLLVSSSLMADTRRPLLEVVYGREHSAGRGRWLV